MNFFDFKISDDYNIIRCGNHPTSKKTIDIIKRDFANNVFPFIVDINFVRIKFMNDGFCITIYQKSNEAVDIIEYFEKRFNKLFPSTKESGCFSFVEYTNVGKSSSINFFYNYNLFEKSYFKTH